MLSLSPEMQDLVQRSEELYETQLKAQLEPIHKDKFLAIEPKSGDYFLGRTMNDAVNACRTAHPDRLCYTMRIGHKVAVEIGNSPA